MDPFGTDYSFEMVGARLLGPTPIRDVWLPLVGGVHAFYGKNGAGKSRLLDALAGLYSGAPRGEGYLVVRSVARSEAGAFGVAPINDRDMVLPPPAGITGLDDRYMRPLLTAFWDAWGEWASPAFADVEDETADPDPYLDFDYSQLDDVDEMDQHERVDLFAEIEHLSARNHQKFDPPFCEADLIGLFDEIAQQRLFALTFDGEFWVVTPAVRIDAGTTRLWSERERSHAPTAYPFEELVPLLAGAEDKVEFALLDKAEVVPYRLGPNSAMGGLRLTLVVDPPPITVVLPDRVGIQDLDATVKARLAQIAAVDDTPHVDHRGEPPVAWRYELERLNERLMEHLASFFVSPPEVGVRVRAPHTWFMGDSTEWFAHDGYREIELKDLSEAHQRWARFSATLAASVASTGIPTRPTRVQREFFSSDELPISPKLTIIGLDEPDGALHATAQRFAVDGLVRVTSKLPATSYVATHSREFLNHPGVTVHHVSRDSGGDLTVRPLDTLHRARCDELGITPADLLLLNRVVLVVEGSHDVTMISRLVGRELDELRVLVLPMRGGRALATVVDSYLLAVLSDTPVLAALDNLRADKVEAYWSDLLDNVDGGQPKFDEITAKHFSSRERNEETFLINYMRQAAELGQVGRFHVFGFEKPDIQDYLPVTALVPGAASWDNLRAEFAEQRRIGSFKPWLRDRYGIDITEELLHAGCDGLDEVPEDFGRLVETCARLSTGTIAG